MKKERLYHAVASKITRMIDEGEFPAGSRLPGERELAERFGVSRVTIREAEIALQAHGLLQIKTGSGVYVLETAKNGGLPEVSAFELTQARLLFESEAAALAALDISDDTLEHLEHLVEKMSSSKRDEADEADRGFHLTIAAASGNAAVRYVVETLWKLRNELGPVKEAYDAVCDEDSKQRGIEHDEILDALRNRKPRAARKAMRQHFSRLLEAMLAVTEEQALSKLRKEASKSRERFLKSV
ncbi:MAG: FadR family transcriptional regulator [Gammaproteobacteria bacterium]|nr:FadR family transcriptional regulator [Gammaproteobacteria bacterium]